MEPSMELAAPCVGSSKHSSAAGRRFLSEYLHHAAGLQGDSACQVSTFPCSSFGSNGYEIIGSSKVSYLKC